MELDLLLVFHLIVIILLVLIVIALPAATRAHALEVFARLQELLLEKAGDLLDEVLLAMVLILLEESLEVDEFAMPDERRQLDFEVLRVEERILLVEVSD